MLFEIQKEQKELELVFHLVSLSSRFGSFWPQYWVYANFKTCLKTLIHNGLFLIVWNRLRLMLKYLTNPAFSSFGYKVEWT